MQHLPGKVCRAALVQQQDQFPAQQRGELPCRKMLPGLGFQRVNGLLHAPSLAEIPRQTQSLPRDPQGFFRLRGLVHRYTGPGCFSLSGQEADIAAAVLHHDQHLNGRVAVAHSGTGTGVAGRPDLIHPVVQRITACSRRRNGKGLGAALLLGLFQLICSPCRCALRVCGQTVRLPAIGVLHQPGDISGQLQFLRQQLPGTSEQPFAIDGCTALVKFLGPGVQHCTAGFLHRLRTRPARMPVQPSDALQQQVHRAQFRNHVIEINIQ